MSKAVKFGGASVANSEQFKKVKQIILADPDRKYVVNQRLRQERAGGP